jgi:hypothetical protein
MDALSIKKSKKSKRASAEKRKGKSFSLLTKSVKDIIEKRKSSKLKLSKEGRDAFELKIKSIVKRAIDHSIDVLDTQPTSTLTPNLVFTGTLACLPSGCKNDYSTFVLNRMWKLTREAQRLSETEDIVTRKVERKGGFGFLKKNADTPAAVQEEVAATTTST